MDSAETVSKIERALVEDWRRVKELKKKAEGMTDGEIRAELSQLNVDLVLEDGDSLGEFLDEVENHE